MLSRVRGELYLLFATLCAAVGWLASKFVLQEISSGAFIAGRFILASLLLLPFCYRRLRVLPSILLVKSALVAVLLASSIHIWVYSVRITNNLSEGAFIMSLAMIIAPLTRWLILNVRPNRAFWLSLPVAILGMVLLTLKNGWHIDISQWYFLLSSFLLSIHFVLNKHLSDEIDSYSSICIQMLFVGMTGILLFLVEEKTNSNISEPVIIWFLVSVFIATSLRYLVQSLGQYKVKPEVSSLIMILEPVWTLILSLIILGESFGMQKLLGAAVIVLSLVTYILVSKKYP